MVTPRTVAVIPARGGSKRIPRKNIIDLHGKPMIAWTIEAALRSGRFSRVLVSTDDPEIAEVSRSYGASVPFLREQHADDVAPVSLATLAALQQAQRELGETFDTVVQLMANCPLRTEQDIVSALDRFAGNAAVAQISCFKFGWMNPWWAAKLGEGGAPEFLFPEARKARSQDLPPLYCPTGAIWISSVEALERHQTFYSPGHVFHPMHWMSALDIDDEFDLEMARYCFSQRHARAG